MQGIQLIFTAHDEVWGKEMCFLRLSFCPGGRESLYDVTFCLDAWSHVPSGGLYHWTETPPPYDKEQVVCILLECILVIVLFLSPTNEVAGRWCFHWCLSAGGLMWPLPVMHWTSLCLTPAPWDLGTYPLLLLTSAGHHWRPVVHLRIYPPPPPPVLTPSGGHRSGRNAF